MPGSPWQAGAVIIGIGVDIVNIARIEAALTRTPRLASRLFAQSELGLPAASLAARFAAKEATAKALGAPPGLRWTDVEIRQEDSGRPELTVRGTVAEAARMRGVWRWHLSLSHEAGVSVAMVVAEGR